MKLTEIILSKYAPQNLRAVWLHPSDTGIEVFIYNNGKWQEISVLGKSGGSVTIGSKDSEFTIIAKDSKVHIQDQDGNVHQVITTETSVGQKTPEGGEIFNDYENNAAGASYAHSEGQKTIATGNSSHAEGVGTKATDANSHSEGNQTTASGPSSHSEGYKTIASGPYSHTEGNGTQATANAAHAEGTNNVASAQNAHAEGQNNTADAAQAHAEGGNNTAHGQNSHAEGNGNTANGGSSHVEGYDNTADGSYCHVEGGHNTASGSGSHAEGIGTTATNEGEHAEGRYNISNNGGTSVSRTVHSVGVGTSNAKRNAHEIMWSGDHYVYSLGGYDGTNYADAQTLQEVINGKQGSTDNTLQTTSKTITGAINELFSSKQNNITPGTGLAFDGDTLNVTLDTTVFRVVSSLPAAPDAGDENKIFLVPAESTGTNNAYTEYLWVNSAWEELGQYISEVDLTPYLRITDAQSTYATKTELTEHTGNTSNPHSVTKAQVGLGNVDNTSDANKPVSTAQQAAIDAVDNKTAVYTTVPTLSADYTIPANATTREYIYEISIGATTYNVTAAEGIKWIDNNLPLVEANSKLIVSVVNNIAVWGTIYE